MSFKKLICNLLLDLHPICIARFMHPICTKTIYKFYLNFRMVYHEYKNTDKYDDKFNENNNVRNINEALVFMADTNNSLLIIKWLLLNGANIHADIHGNKDYALYCAVYRG